MKAIIFLLMILCMNIPGWTAGHSDLRISAGAGMLVLQSAYSFQQSTGLTAAVRGDWTGNLDWQLGARLGLDPAGYEAFTRLLAAPQLGVWQPVAGLELGLTGRTDFEPGDKLLRESRRAMENNISPFYMGCYAAPLTFAVSNRWTVSLIGLQIATHLDHIGRSLRVQIEALSLELTF